MITEMNFQSKRLTTRELLAQDASTLFEIYSDAEAMKFRGSGPVTSFEDAQHMISNQCAVSSNSIRTRFGIMLKESGSLIGTLLLQWTNSEPEQCEIGFSFGKAYWRQGFGRETLTMLEDKFREIEEITELKAWVVKENVGSMNLFQTAGFSDVSQNEYPKSTLFIKSV